MVYFDRLAVPKCATLALLLLVSPAFGQSPPDTAVSGAGTLSGTVSGTDDSPLEGVDVVLVDLHRSTTSGTDGGFRFENVPPGSYLLEASREDAGSAVRRVDVAEDTATVVALTLALVRHDDEIVVTASGMLRSQLEIAQPTSVLSGEELTYRLQPSLGETLAQEPGISSTFFGAGASRPVIRGLGGDRVRMLQGGLDTGDVSSTSPDHAVSTEPAAAERIEVLRGPATLLYGSSAIGGVVNVIDGRIPDVRPEATSGFLELRGGSVASERSATFEIAGAGGPWAWHVDATTRDTGDYDIPGFAAVDDEHDEDEHGEEEHGEEENPSGTLPNSDLESTSGAFGLSRFFGDHAFVGLSVSTYTSEYGVPGAGHAHGEEGGAGEEAEEGEEIRIDLERLRLDLRGEVNRPFGPFSGLRVRIGLVDYEHAELEGSERAVGTRFFNDFWESRLELVQRPRGRLSGALGLQLARKDLEAVGEEAFIPPATTDSRALFTFQEIDRGALRFQAGARWESQDVDSGLAGMRDRSFDGLSGSLGLVWLPTDGYSIALSAARSVKLPNAEELYSDGPHFATQAFEVGNSDLGEETSLGLDVALRKTTGRLRATLSVFVNRFDDFIYQDFTGAELDGLPVLAYTQDDAEFVGAELSARLELWETGDRHLDLALGADWVQAELHASGQPLPRIPPRSLSLALHYHTPRWHTFVESESVADQDRLAPEETFTGGYTLLGAGLSYRIFLGQRILDLVLRGRNLGNEEARNHVSFLKDRVPLPGRDVSLAVRWTF